MTDSEREGNYNYDSFVPRNFEPWMRFGESPPVAGPGPDFPLQRLEGGKTALSELWGAQDYL
ncbi:MAG: deiodinase-related protein, partial [Planctomycetota bacterium]